MGAGLSMASVNKIKELANSREYSLALELVEHQDLTKSLNPQFLRLCGEVYIKNGRYEDARRCLIMAHRLGPESKRIIYSFVELYLRMGYFQLAEKYYDMYMFDADIYDSRQMEYIWKKHLCTESYSELEPLLAGYAHNLDYDWSFELYLLYKKEKKDEEAGMLAELYHASYKNSEYSQVIRQIEAGTESTDTFFNVYAMTAVEDDAPQQETLRKEEQELLAADDLRMHPKEAEITIMYEDAYTPAESEKKIQRMLRKQAKEEEKKEKKLLKKQKQQESATLEPPEVSEETETTQTEETVKQVETKEAEGVAEDTSSETESKQKQGFLKKLLRKKQSSDVTQEASLEEETSVTQEGSTEETSVARETSSAEETSVTQEGSIEEASVAQEGSSVEEVQASLKTEKNDKLTESDATVETAKITEQLEQKETENVEISTQGQPEKESDNTDADRTGRAEAMRQKTRTIADDIVVVEEDDGFEAEADTIEELASAEEQAVTKKRQTYVFETVELAPEDFDEYEVDDFSDTVDEEFGEMKLGTEDSQPEEAAEPEVEELPQPEEAAEPEVEELPQPEEAAEPEVEELPQPEEIAEPEVEEPQPEETAEPEVEDLSQPEEAVEPEVEEAQPEEAAEPEVEELPQPEEAAEPEVEELPQPEEAVEPEVEEPQPEEAVEPEVEELPQPEKTAEPEVEEPQPEETVEPEVEELPQPEGAAEPEFYVAPFTTKPEKKKLDFPVFKSSLFPNYHKDVKQVENNFGEIMAEAQDKMSENMQKEEQMQREAEALLASLGIHMDSIASSQPAEKEMQPDRERPSRDALKASLKIDSVKKDLLKKVKTYR